MKKQYIIVLIIAIIAIASGCARRRDALVSMELYEFHCKNLGDNELIAEYYRIDLQLQEAIDELEWLKTRLLIEQQKGGIESGSSALGTSLGIAISGRNPARIVKELRAKRAIILTIIHQRGLQLPT